MTINDTYLRAFKGELSNPYSLIMVGFNEDGIHQARRCEVTGTNKVVVGLEKYAEDLVKLIAIFSHCRLDVDK